MTIKGSLQTTKTNDYGFTSVKMGGAWYGADKKGFKPEATEGDLVEFEAFKNAKGYDTYKTATFRKVAASQTATGGAEPGNGPRAAGGGQAGTAGNRQDYWAAKGTEDAKRDPRISYFASLERAIQFVDLALRNGAINAYEKAKATGKLEVLTALVYETTQKIMAEAYAQTVPAPLPAAPKAPAAATEPEQAELESDPEETWA